LWSDFRAIGLRRLEGELQAFDLAGQHLRAGLPHGGRFGFTDELGLGVGQGLG
jgi:hypothetical protein